MRRRTIVVRSPNWVGDAVVSTAVLKPLRDYFKNEKIIVVAKEYVYGIFENNSYINDIIIFKGFKDSIKKIKGDIGIILPNSFSSALLFALSGIKRRIGYRSEQRSFLLTDAITMPQLRKEHLLDNYKRIVLSIIKSGDPLGFTPGIFLSKDEEGKQIFERFDFNNIKPVIIDPGSAYGKAKVWKVDKYAGLVDYIMKVKKLPVVLLGSKDGVHLVKEIIKMTDCTPFILTGKLSLRESIVAISKCNLFISPDTGGMHIAASLGVKQIAIFGSSSPLWTGPINPRSRVIYKNLPCSPCFKRRCPKGTYECFKKITLGDVKQSMEELL